MAYIMKRVFCFLIFLGSCNQTEMNLTDLIRYETEIKTDYLFCFDDTIELYTCSSKDPNVEFEYGSFVVFSKDGSFQSYTKQWCGNGCFPTVYGKYTLTAETNLSVSVDSVHHTGWCTSSSSASEWTEYRKPKLIRFTLKNKDDHFELKLNK